MIHAGFTCEGDIDLQSHTLKVDSITESTAGQDITFDKKVLVNQDGNDKGIVIDSEATTAGEDYAALSIYTGQGATGIHAEYASNATGFMTLVNNPNGGQQASFYFYRDLAAAATDCPLMSLKQDNAGDDQDLLLLTQDGTGKGINMVMPSAAGVGFYTNGLIQGVNVTSGADPGHTHTAYETAGAVAEHAPLQTGVHGISITAGKTFSCTGTLTLAGTDGSTLNIGTGGTLGTGAYATIANYAPLDNPSFTTGLTLASDTDVSATIGRGKLGYDGTNADNFIVAHIDNATQASKALAQNASGDTILNCKTGKNVFFRINNSSIAKLTTTGIEPGADATYYLGRNDDDTPMAWKGLICKDTTNGKYYRIEIINGTITATDLTD